MNIRLLTIDDLWPVAIFPANYTESILAWAS